MNEASYKCKSCGRELGNNDAYCPSCGKMTPALKEQLGGKAMMKLTSTRNMAVLIMAVGVLIIALLGTRIPIAFIWGSFVIIIGIVFMVKYRGSVKAIRTESYGREDLDGYCSLCGEKLLDDYKYCSTCGTKAPKKKQ